MKLEKGEKGGGVGLDAGTLALLFCVIDDNRAGPGTSISKLVKQPLYMNT